MVFIITSNWKWPKCPSTGKGINKPWYSHVLEFYLAIKRNEQLHRWISEDGRSVIWVQCCMFPFTWSTRIGHGKNNHTVGCLWGWWVCTRTLTTGGMMELSEVIEMLLVVVWIILLCAFVKTHWMIYLRFVHFFTYILLVKKIITKQTEDGM